MMLLPRLIILCTLCVLVSSQQEVYSQNKNKADQQQSGKDQLATLVDRAIDTSTRRFLTADIHSPWQIMHGMLALRQDFQLLHNGKKVTALKWLTDDAQYKGDAWFEVTQFGGRAHPYSRPYAFEGHVNQFLAIMTMSNLPKDYKIKAGNQHITIGDIVKNSQMTMDATDEMTWTLWALSHYLPPDARWKNQNGEVWSIERLVKMQIDEHVSDAPCGGSHGLYALTYSRNQYLKSGKRLRGVWLEADQKIQQYLSASRSMQNNDGTFSTNYFASTGWSGDFIERLGKHGHSLEWIRLALPEDRLNEQWVRQAVGVLGEGMIENASTPAKCGPLYHALHALVLHRERTRPNYKQEQKLVEQKLAAKKNEQARQTELAQLRKLAKKKEMDRLKKQALALQKMLDEQKKAEELLASERPVVAPKPRIVIDTARRTTTLNR